MLRAAAEIDAGEAPPDLPGRLIEENMWRALRYGLDGRLLDLEAPVVEEFPAAETARPPEGVEPASTRRCPSSTAPSASAA